MKYKSIKCKCLDKRLMLHGAWMMGVFLFLSAPSVRAALLVYEGFNGYSDGSLGGQSVVNTTGLTGSYVAAAGTANATSTGLTFSDLQVSGGSAASATTTGTALGVSLDSSVSATGTIYSSFLLTLSGSTGGSVYLRVNDSASAGGASQYFVTAGNFLAKTGVGYDASILTLSGVSLSLNTTYAVVGRFTNVGGSSGVATLWVLDAAQFDTFKTGGFTDAELDGASIGTGSNNIISRIAESATRATTFETGDGIQFNLTSATSGSSHGLDEIRWGTTLDDVLPIVIPEPSSWMLLGLGLASLAVLKRRPIH